MRQGRVPLLALMLLSCLISNAFAAEPDADSVAVLIDEAESARQRAAELAAEWLKTGELIAQAREAAQRDDFQLAAQLAERARRQGELAVAQAEREATAWQRRVVR